MSTTTTTRSTSTGGERTNLRRTAAAKKATQVSVRPPPVSSASSAALAAANVARQSGFFSNDTMDDDASPSADTVQPAQEQVELLAEGTVVPAAAAAAVPRPVMVHVPPGSRLIRVPHGETAPSYIDTLFELQGECKGADAEYSYFVVPDCDVDAYASDRCAFDYDSAIPRDANDAAAATLSRGISYYHRSAWYLEPPEIVTVLKPYQTEGRQFLMDRSGAREVMPDGYRMNPHGAILADRMGLGKTLQVLAAIVDTIGAYMSQCADTTQQALATLSHADAAAAAVTTTTAAAPSTSSSSSMAVPMSSLYMRSRAFYRGPPSLVVAPPNAIQAWATEVRRHTRGLAVAQIERDNTLWVFTHPERPELNIDGAAPMRVEGILELSDLLSYDILFVTYNRIMLSAPSALMQLLQDFNPLVPQKTTATRLALQQSQRYSAANWDDMCRPQRPVLYNRPNELGTACLWVLSLSWLVADEAHVLGNPKNKRTQAMWTLYANNYAMVTATPTSNHLGELAPLMLLIRAQNLPEVANWERVRRNQVKARKVDDIPAAAASAAQSGAPVLYLGGDPNNAAVTFELTDQTVSRLESVGAHDLALIQAAIIHNALARTEEQAGLRQQFTVHRWVIKYPFVNVAERLLNRLTLAQAQEWFKRLELDEVDGRQIYHRVLPLFTRAKQIAIAANTVIRTRLNRGGAAANSIAPHVQRFFELPEFGLSATKLQLLFALLADESRIARTEKVIICCSFRSVLELIAERFKQTKVGHALITGAEYDRQRRADTIRRFQTDPTVRFALVTLRVAQSIDLTAACHAVFLDPWHNPSVQEQAGGRITRLSQLAKHVHLWYLLVADSVEEPTHAAAERKRREADYLMHGFVDPNDITTDSLLSLEQLRLVLSSMDDAALAPPMDEWLPAHLGAQPLQLSSLNGMSTLQRMPTNQELLDVLTTNVAADVTNVLVDSGTFGAAEDEETGGTDMTTLAAIRRMVGVQTTSQ